MFLKTEFGQEKNILREVKLKNIENIEEVFEVAGNYNLIMRMKAKDMHELQKLVSKIKKLMVYFRRRLKLLLKIRS